MPPARRRCAPAVRGSHRPERAGPLPLAALVAQHATQSVGVSFALVHQRPLRFTGFQRPLAGFGISCAIGVAAGLGVPTMLAGAPRLGWPPLNRSDDTFESRFDRHDAGFAMSVAIDTSSPICAWSNADASWAPFRSAAALH